MKDEFTISAIYQPMWHGVINPTLDQIYHAVFFDEGFVGGIGVIFTTKTVQKRPR